MIKIKNLRESDGVRGTDRGKSVIYRKHDSDRVEEGIITSWNDEYVFVRYGRDKLSKATRPEDLSWVWESITLIRGNLKK